MSADSDAFQTTLHLPNLTDEDRQYLLTVARGEGFYGLGWGNPNAQTVELSAKFGIDPHAGVGSNNWGAEQGSGSAGSFPHVDHHADGSPYVEKYKRHITPVEGAASVARILLKPNVRAALATGVYQGAKSDVTGPLKGRYLGPLRAAVYTQHDNHYFELNPDKYLSAVKTNYDKLTANLKWPTLLAIKDAVPTVPNVPLASDGSQSSEPQSTSSGEPSESLNGELPEAGFIRGQRFSVPGVQDE